MRGVAAAALAIAMASSHLAAQESDTPQTTDDEMLAGPVSELDLLSRSVDDPFAGVIAKEKREPISVTLRALDKITARYTDLEVPMNTIAHFGSLEILPRTCDKRPPEEFPETTAFLEIFDTQLDDQVSNFKPAAQEEIEDEIEAAEIMPLAVAPAAGDAPTSGASAEVIDGPVADGINIFRGWMFASSPALNPLEHAVYDVWVKDCKTRVVGN